MLFLYEVLTVPSSSITVVSDGEYVTCGGFSPSEPISLHNIDFITDYFGGLSLSPRRGNDSAVFMGSTHGGASTPQRATIKDSHEEFLTVSSGEASFGYLSPRPRSTGAPLAPTTTATWKENTLAMMMFPPRTVVPLPKTNQTSE
jgi:hypothetical protein